MLKKSCLISLQILTLLLSLSFALAQEQAQNDEESIFNAQEDPALLAELFRRRRQAGSSADPSQAGGNVFKFLSDLGPQVEKAQSSAKMFTSLFNQNQAAPGGGQSGSQQANPLQSATSALQSASVMSSLNDMLRSAQDGGNKLTSSAQTNLQQAQDSSAQAAEKAQGGIQSALTEIGQGLQKIASNNPNLLPDVKNLYQSVSTKLSSASSSVSQAIPSASNTPTQAQLSDSLAKAIQI